MELHKEDVLIQLLDFQNINLIKKLLSGLTSFFWAVLGCIFLHLVDCCAELIKTQFVVIFGTSDQEREIMVDLHVAYIYIYVCIRG